jgi:hypothetical protein
MDLINNYKKAKNLLYKHVGFQEDWVIYPIDDRTEMFWEIDEDSDCVKFAETINEFNSDGDYYLDEIYKQRFYEKHIFRGDKLTMIIVDTHTDANKFFAFYDNIKEINV